MINFAFKLSPRASFHAEWHFTCINESAAVIQCTKVGSREGEKGVQFVKVTPKPWPREHWTDY